MRISYDPEVDALYIRLLDGSYQCRTVRINADVALNIGTGEELVGIEILDARHVLGGDDLPEVVVEKPLAAAS